MKILIAICFLLGFYVSPAQNLSKIWSTDPVILKHKSDLETLFKAKGSALGNAVFIRIFKQTDKNPQFGELEVWGQKTNSKEYSLVQSYQICYYSGGLGSKHKQGDGKTPEGCYSITAQSLNQYSTFHRSCNIGYPNVYERSCGYTGSAIMIHGNCVSIGCIAMTDERIEPIWTTLVAALHSGHKTINIHIFPFPLTQENLEAHQSHKDYSTWKTLQQIYLAFETNHIPPTVKTGKSGYSLTKTQ